MEPVKEGGSIDSAVWLCSVVSANTPGTMVKIMRRHRRPARNFFFMIVVLSLIKMII